MKETFLGDCREVLKDFPSNSLDSLVTDPPAGIGFMGKQWDKDKGGRDHWVKWMTEVMAECLRVLKPGAHGLVWALPRTSHWTATALENAGFEVRDILTHLFGTGFPKSLDISKAIDKAAGAERTVIRPGFKSSDEQGATYSKGLNAGFQERELTAPSTDAAKQWQGWGTALKPASEHWILVRKPLSERTVAANVLEHGTGGINIDACRVGTKERIITPTGTRIDQSEGRDHEKFLVWQAKQRPKQVTGRFPADLILSHNEDCEDECTDGCAVAMLDEQSGQLHLRGNKKETNLGGGMYGHDTFKGVGLSESGFSGASRFFYIAKASKADRGEGNTHPTVKSTKLMEYLIKLVTPPGGTVLDPFMGSGSTGVAATRAGFRFSGIEKEKEYYEIAFIRLSFGIL